VIFGTILRVRAGSSGTPRDAIRIIDAFSAPVDVNQAARIANAMYFVGQRRGA
jgi:hypothetical protein